ncbi:MAG: exo-beta-N-acetylmuramidase NamZ domain-containing protein [Phycisphaerae bacterium]
MASRTIRFARPACRAAASTGRALCLAILIAFPAFGQGADESPGAGGPRLELGVDVLIRRAFAPLAGKRVGLITNPSGVTRDLRPTIDVLHDAGNVKLVALFGPEHGVRGEAHAGDKVADSKDDVTGLPVRSLYGATRKPTPEMLSDIDVLVFDLQDIGSRSYTFISTMAVAMEAAAEQDVAFVVLDRPNPLGGERVEGRVLDPRFASFVGQLPIPYVHGMTVGELARMINDEGWLGGLQDTARRARETATAPESAASPSARPFAGGLRCELTIVPMVGWKRSMIWQDTGLTWTPTSPHIPRADSALYYAATGVLGELGVVSVGVGYTLPFELIGRPALDPVAFAGELNRRKLPGVLFRPVHYRPFYAAFQGETCGGVQVVLTDPRRAELTAIQIHAMDALRALDPGNPLIHGKRDEMFDKVCGGDGVRRMINDGQPIDELLAYWRAGVEGFKQRRAKYLMY